MHFLLADYYLINASFFEIACFDNYDYWTNKSFLDRDFTPTVIKKTQLYQKQIQNNSFIRAVVKADAYGHGAVEVSRTLQDSSD